MSATSNKREEPSADHRAEPESLREVNLELTRNNSELESLVLALSKALQRSEAVAQVTLGSVHDFRNALTVIQGEAVFLAERLHEPEQLNSLNALDSACRQATAIARDMLHRLRSSHEQETLVDGSELVARCRELILRVAKTGVRCVFDLAPYVWPVAVESHQLEAALVNLSANARDAMPNGGELSISVRNRTNPKPGMVGDYVAFTIKDTGVGMPPDVLARATEPFFTTKGPQRGTGLGLAMVQAFVTAARGVLSIDSELGRGTRVEILLPRANCSVPPSSALEREDYVSRIRQQVQTPWLRRILQAWRAACQELGLPRPARVEAALVEHKAHCIVLKSDGSGAGAPRLRLLHLGVDLMELLAGGERGGASLTTDVVQNLAAGYRRALESGVPSYEYARYSFGEGKPFEFERLILPAAASGARATHLFGVVRMSNPNEEGA
ncbi:MAG TPA: ATP-binding protein [Polyangiaceae bacterium]|nr:ATP-binding protein [Polyangiaceae bacterium]